jgi:O-acetyl-ADP-ribose deacetylase (regulator of RNase III)
VKTIAFPAISTGIYRFPKDLAAGIAVRECREFADACGVETVEFVCFDEASAVVYERLLEALRGH